MIFKKISLLSLVFFRLFLSPFFIRDVGANEGGLISTQAVVTASMTKSGSNVSNINDGSFTTSWESGASATQWVMFDFITSKSINKIRFLPAQNPSGRTVHNIYVGDSISSLKLLVTIDQITQKDVWVEAPLLSPINTHYLKVETVESPSWIAWKEIEVYEGQSKASSNLKYFGYLSNDYNYQTPTYFQELSSLGNTNIAWGTNNLSDFKRNNIQVLYPPESFWTRPKTGPDAGKLKLIPTWSTLWATERATKIDPYIDNIYGFYMDEPYWNGITKEEFAIFTQALHNAYPSKKILILEAAPPIRNQEIPLDYYKNVTDIGFDHYFTLLSSNNDEGWIDYLSLNDKFKPYTTGKNYWLVPDGFGPASYSSRWMDSYEKYTSLAMTTPNTVGMLGFIYNLPSELRSGNIGLYNLLEPSSPYYDSQFRARQIEIGKSIINKPISIPTYQDSDLEPDGDVDIADYNTILNNFGLSGLIGWIRSDIIKNGVVDIYDFNKLITEFGQ